MINFLRRMLLVTLVTFVVGATAPDSVEAQIWCPSCEWDVGCTVIEGAGLEWCANIMVFDFEFCVGGGSGYCTGEPLSALDGTVIPASEESDGDQMEYVWLPSTEATVSSTLDEGNQWTQGRYYKRGCQDVIVVRRYDTSVAAGMREVTDQITL